jgi:hypothetical protein
MSAPGTPTPREVGQQAAGLLAQMADRYMRAAQSLTHMVMRLSTLKDSTKISTSIAKYQQSALPEPEALTDILEMLEGTKSPEWRDKRAKQRLMGWREHLRHRLTQNLSHYGKWASQPPPEDWSRDVVLACARKERDAISAAIAVCEQRKDSDEALEALQAHLAGEHGVYFLESRLEALGLSVEESNVVPLVPRAGGRR